MNRISLALMATLLMAGSAWAKPALDEAGKCRDNGKFVKQAMCATTPPVAAKCRDMTSKKFTKCGTANTEPVPSPQKTK
jgi:hypothetical protein